MHLTHTEEQTLHLTDHQLHLRWVKPVGAVTSEKPVLVFLHDSLGCIKLWRDFPERLAQETGCVALLYDRRGYGSSSPFAPVQRAPDYLEREADALEMLLNELQLPEAILFGHSDGGSIALIAAAKHPQRIRGIITEGAHVFVEEETLAGIQEALQAYRTTTLPEKLQKYHGAKTEAVFKAWTGIWLSERFRNWNITHLLPAIHCPSLIIQGEADEYGTLAQVEAILAQVQGPSEKFIIPGIGHTPHREAPEEVLQQASRFVRALLSPKV